MCSFREKVPLVQNCPEIKKDSVVGVRIKKENLCFFNSIILCDYLEFLLAFKF